MALVSDASASIEFGRYTVEPHRRELLADGQPIKLGGRAFDLLMALIEASGAVVSKDVLLDRVWPGRIVEENRLQNQVSSLRPAFGADHGLILTIAGRGYQFTGDIRARPARSAARLVVEVPPGTQAIDWARRQGALSFELRAATSLARLQRDQGRPADAMALLQPVYDRFTEGFETADLKAAKMLLKALAEHANLRVSQD